MQYQNQNSTQMLWEGLADYYGAFLMLDRFALIDQRMIAQVFYDFDRYLDIPLATLRQEFNLHVLTNV